MVLFVSKFLVDSVRYSFRIDVSVRLNSVTYGLIGFSVKQALGRPQRFVDDEASLELVLPLLVPWRSCLVADVPAMVVNIPGVCASIRGLRTDLGIGFVFEALSDQEVLSLHWQLSVGIELFRSGDAGVPSLLFGTKQVFVNFILHYSSNSLSLIWHVFVLVEKGVLGVIVDLLVFDAANGLGSFMKSRLG